MSEHTAEYVLVNDLVHRLTPAFPNIIPIFFWATREGNRFALESMDDQNLRLVTCFARRPKVDPTCGSLLMKINREIIIYRHACALINIPVLVGLPMVKSLSALRLNSPCNWFDLANFDYADGGDCHFTISWDAVTAATRPLPNLPGPLTNMQIEELVKRSPIVSWSRAVDHIRDVRRTVSEQTIGSYGYWRFSFIGGYKPFFLLVLGD
jgi:hypothetical protein